MLRICSGVSITPYSMTKYKYRPLYASNYLAYTNGDLYCWITISPNVSSSKFVIQLMYSEAPSILGLIIIVVGYALAIRQLKKIPEDILEQLDVNVYKLLWYPASLFLTFIPSIVYNLVRETEEVVVQVLDLLFTRSVGFTNAIVYGLQSKVFAVRKDKFSSLIASEGRSSGSLRSQLVKAYGYVSEDY